MLADYVMKSIDSLFSDRLKCKEIPKKTKDGATFDKEVIRKSLHKVIKKDQPTEGSTFAKNTQPVSPVSKSKLKIFLQTNREEQISSVLKVQKLPLQSSNFIGSNRTNNHRNDHSISKENNVTRFYQQMRKSTQKSQQRSKSPKRGLQVSKAAPSLIRNASKRWIGGMRV